MGNVVQGVRDPTEIGEQVFEGGGEQSAEYQHQHQSQPHQLPQQAAERRLQHIAIHHHGQQPVGARYRLYRQQHIPPVEGGGVQLAVFAAPLLEGGGRESRRQLGDGLECQILLRMADDEATAVEQHGVALTLHLHRQHFVDQLV